MVEPKLEFKKYLGKGSYGSVSLFKYSKPRTTFYTAVKTTNDKTALEKEFQILSQFKGRSSIIQLYENKLIEHPNGEGSIEYMMLMEYAAGGSLRSFMNRSQDKKLPDQLIREFTLMILQGLATIHGHGYVHCDLKPENILVFPKAVYKKGEWRSSFELKISDFGVSTKDGDTNWWHPARKPFAGTPIYMSPESISRGETGKGLDLWSLGCVVLEMYTGKSPWWHKNYDLEDLKNYNTPLIPSDLPCDARNFIVTCLALKTDERSDALTLLKHSFVCGDVNKINEIAERPSKVMSIVKRVGELKIFKRQIRKPKPNLLPVYCCSLVEPSRKYWFIIGSSIWVVLVIIVLVSFYF